MSVLSQRKRIWRRGSRTSAERRHSLAGPAEHWELKRDFQISFLQARGLEPGHHLLDILNIGERAEGSWQLFPVVWRSLSFYQEACVERGMQAAAIGPLHELGHRTGIDSQDQQCMLEITRVRS